MTRRTRRTRRPRPLVNPVLHAIEGARLLWPVERALLLDPPREALDALRTGNAGQAPPRALVDALNMAEALVELRIAGNLGEQVLAGQAALGNLARRVSEGRGWTMYGHELVALDEALWVYATQLDHCCVSEWQSALGTVQRRIGAALAGNAGPRVTVHAPWVAA